jgi:Tfp pilus assembly protein FimT
MPNRCWGVNVMRTKSSGYSLVEVMLVVLLMGVSSRVAINQIAGSMNSIDADVASNTVFSQIQYARQSAIDQRRNILVEFLGTNEVKITRQELGGGTTVLSDVRLPSGYTFAMPAGIGDTPDGYGNTAPVYFNGATSGTFLGDGTFVSSSNVLVNGSVFTMGAGTPSARVITLSASTGGVKQYWIKPTTWALR